MPKNCTARSAENAAEIMLGKHQLRRHKTAADKRLPTYLQGMELPRINGGDEALGLVLVRGLEPPTY